MAWSICYSVAAEMELNKPKKREQVTSKMHEIYDKCAPTVKFVIVLRSQTAFSSFIFKQEEIFLSEYKKRKSGLAMRG